MNREQEAKGGSRKIGKEPIVVINPGRGWGDLDQGSSSGDGEKWLGARSTSR